jgi:serine protease Do
MKALLACVLLGLSLVMSGTSCAQAKEDQKKDEAPTASRTRPGWLGVSISDMTSRQARKMNLKTEDGAYIDHVGEDSPAEKAGLKEGDVIVEFNGKTINDAGDLRRFVRRSAPGTSASVVVVRKDEKKTLQVTLGKTPREPYTYGVVPPVPPVMPYLRALRGSSIEGMNLSDLNKQLGEYFEAPNGRGVLVEEVDRNSSAEKAGFKAGDVIIRVGKESVEDTHDIWDALQDSKDGDKAEVEIIRKGARKSLTLEIDQEALGNLHHPSSRPRHFEFFQQEFAPMEKELRKSGELKFQEENLRRSMEGLKEQLKSVGEKVRDEMIHLQQELRKELSASWS